MKLILFVWIVYADGGICLDILQNRWSPTYDVSAILTSIQVNKYFFVNIFFSKQTVHKQKHNTFNYHYYLI